VYPRLSLRLRAMSKKPHAVPRPAFSLRDSIAHVSGLVLAARYLTIVPVPGREDHGSGALGRAALWFPVVGLGLGGALAAGERVVAAVFPPLLGALLVVTAWKLASGGLHLDGLADCFDGLVGRDAEHRLAIMRDSRIGAFGALGLILFLLLEIAAVAELGPSLRWRALLAAPVVARAMPPLLACCFRGARADGHDAVFRAGVSGTAALGALVLALAVAAIVLGTTGVVVAALATAAALAVGAFMSRRLGGITGDVHGAAVETAELVVLVALTAWTHNRP
jgi:adenosylcobinamide-GDP ribazoletransferase